MTEEFYKTFEFKGVELEPFGEGRRSVAFAIGVKMSRDAGPTIADMHAILFICSKKFRELSVAFRNPDQLWEQILEWANANINPADYDTEMELVKSLMENAISTKAEPLENSDMLADPVGN